MPTPLISFHSFPRLSEGLIMTSPFSGCGKLRQGECSDSSEVTHVDRWGQDSRPRRLTNPQCEEKEGNQEGRGRLWGGGLGRVRGRRKGWGGPWGCGQGTGGQWSSPEVGTWG